MSNSNNGGNGVGNGGIGFVGLLTVAFIVLKLCDVIDWSWVWVLSPLWISVILTILFMLAFFVFYWRKR